jgi:hypothetical protein
MRYWKFICKNDTEAECFKRRLLGDRKHSEEVKKVDVGDTCFLYNIETDVLYGPFKAKSRGELNIEPEAWSGRFPAQVKVDWEVIAKIVDASKEFSFLREDRLWLTEEEGGGSL